MKSLMRSAGGFILAGAVIITAGAPLVAKKAKTAGTAADSTSVSLNSSADDKKSEYSLIKVTSVDIGFANYFTLGKYKDLSDMNFGPSLQVNLEFAGIKLLRVYGALGYSYNITNSNRLDSIHDLTAHFGAGINLSLSKYFSITPQAGYGVITHLGYGDFDLTGEKGYHIFVDQIFAFEVEAAFHFKVGANDFGMKLFLAPSYMVFIEEEHAGQEIGYRIGLGMEF